MNNNTFLYRVGLNPKNFINNDIEPININKYIPYLAKETNYNRFIKMNF